MKVMIVVTHLLGTGHLSRALTLGRAFAGAGHRVCVVSGGMPAPQLDHTGLDLCQLPPLRSDGVDFTRLLTDSGAPADTSFLATRQAALMEEFRRFHPDVLITELYPFGRRSLKAEFLALLETAKSHQPPPVVLSSIRDILAPPSKPAKAEEAETVVERYFDAVLVHSDPSATRLEVSWPVTPLLARKLRYTGYVAPPAAGSHPAHAGKGEIIVSAGGGPVGKPIFHAAIETARKMTNRRWRLLVGGADASARAAELQALAADASVLAEPARPDFRSMLYEAAASVSMCGYNTALDLMQAGTPSVIVPFDDGKEVEQGLRARALSGMPGFAVVESVDLKAENLERALLNVMCDPPRDSSELKFDGAAESVRIAEELEAAR
ncbi:glycosyltransferase family protein [Ruegeria aquimaris]|uniref:Glycosyltransferase n=1 Tax=Ruegeria aquimaris TaxID=2984333 RepID=A0ABT3AID9_9RHOB|nr:glycosyltransferase [Ruegeria sp. XHP0148]MCV2888447.1 glycosyltransferase [Ruegeria sp. XHP0148]